MSFMSELLDNSSAFFWMAGTYSVFVKSVADMPPKEKPLHPANVLAAVNTKDTNPLFNFPMYFLVFLV